MCASGSYDFEPDPFGLGKVDGESARRLVDCSSRQHFDAANRANTNYVRVEIIDGNLT